MGTDGTIPNVSGPCFSTSRSCRGSARWAAFQVRLLARLRMTRADTFRPSPLYGANPYLPPRPHKLQFQLRPAWGTAHELNFPDSESMVESHFLITPLLSRCATF